MYCAETLIHLMKSNCLNSLLFGLELMMIWSRTDVHNLSFPRNRAYVKMLHINESATIKWYQYFFGQLPTEQAIDYRKFKFLRKIIDSKVSCECCDLNIIYKSLSKFELQTLCIKYNLDFNLEISVKWFLKTLWNTVYDSIDK